MHAVFCIARCAEQNFSTIIYFRLVIDPDGFLQRFATVPNFKYMMTIMEELLRDILQRCAPPARGRLQSVMQKFIEVSKKRAIEESLLAVERRKVYFTMVLNSSNLGYIQKVYSEIMSLSTSELHKALTTWLEAPDYYSQHTIYLTHLQLGTESPTCWLRESAFSSKFLWLQSKSDCEKSVVASHPIE